MNTKYTQQQFTKYKKYFATLFNTDGFTQQQLNNYNWALSQNLDEYLPEDWDDAAHHFADKFLADAGNL